MFTLVALNTSLADALGDIRARGYFTWGADEAGGGPFIFPDPDQPERRTGFEVDLAAALAGELSRALGTPIEARFVQAQWESLPDLLRTGRIDTVLNGYEWTAERAMAMAPTIPYYVYELQLLARIDEPRFNDWQSFLALPGGKIGVLGGSAAEFHLREALPPAFEIVSYDGNTNAMGDVVQGRLDATLQDLPIAVFYRREFPGLRPIGEPRAPGRYVMFVRLEETALRDALNAGIESLRGRGELRRVYERYGIWTHAQTDGQLLALPAPVAETQGPAPGFLARHGRTLLAAAGMTVQLSLASMPLAILLGIAVALGRLYGPRPARLLLGAYVEVLRGTPLMLQLFVIFYVFPAVGLTIDPVPAAILGLAINYSAYEAEIYRAGLQAIPVGQMEAALALGMSRWLALRRIVLPQAVRIVIPPVTNDFIALFKDTSVCSVVTVVELTKRYNIAVLSSPSEVIPLAAITALLYLAMSYPLAVLAGRMETRLRS